MIDNPARQPASAQSRQLTDHFVSMARVLRLQFDRLGGNVQFHSGQPLTIDLDGAAMTEHAMPVMSLKNQLENLLRTQKGRLKDNEQLDPWTLTAAAMCWSIGDQILVCFRNFQDYLPRPLPDIVTITWTVREAVQWTIMSQICCPGNQPCKLGWQNEKQYLWYVSGEKGMWVVFGQYEGQWDWEVWKEEEAQLGKGHHFGGMLLHNKVGPDKLEVAFEDFDPELQVVIVSQSPVDNYKAMPDICKDSQWIAYHAASIDGRVLQHMHARFQADVDIVNAAVRQFPQAIQWASEALQQKEDRHQLYQ